MVVFSSSRSLNPRLAGPTLGGVGAGVLAAATVALLPADMLEPLVWSSGVAALLPAAQPPLGVTARCCLALGGGAMAGAVAWAVLFLLFGPGGFLARGRHPKPRVAARRRRTARAPLPATLRADRHPDAPPRPPMTAADLGTPLMEVAAAPPAVRPLPADLDQPLAAFDPGAIPASPREPVRPVAPLAPGERIGTFALATPAPSVAPTRREPGAPSIDALLRRLEEGAARRTRASAA